jgi:hypothetical protein
MLDPTNISQYETNIQEISESEWSTTLWSSSDAKNKLEMLYESDMKLYNLINTDNSTIPQETLKKIYEMASEFASLQINLLKDQQLKHSNYTELHSDNSFLIIQLEKAQYDLEKLHQVHIRIHEQITTASSGEQTELQKKLDELDIEMEKKKEEIISLEEQNKSQHQNKDEFINKLAEIQTEKFRSINNMLKFFIKKNQDDTDSVITKKDDAFRLANAASLAASSRLDAASSRLDVASSRTATPSKAVVPYFSIQVDNTIFEVKSTDTIDQLKNKIENIKKEATKLHSIIPILKIEYPDNIRSLNSSESNLSNNIIDYINKQNIRFSTISRDYLTKIINELITDFNQEYEKLKKIDINKVAKKYQKLYNPSNNKVYEQKYYKYKYKYFNLKNESGF